MIYNLILTTASLMTFSFVIGVWAEKINQYKKQSVKPWSSKYWHTCRECMPGVTMKFGAETREHLVQVVKWHKTDFHQDEEKDEN